MVFFLAVLSWAKTNAQQTSNASGGEATGSGGTVSYSVGQTGFISQSGSGGSVLPGVQQAYEIFITSNEGLQSVNLSISAYPNPTASNLTLQVEMEKLDKLSYSVFDMNGKLLVSEKISAPSSSIDIQNKPSAVYFLKVYQDKNEIKSFKIIKK